MHVLGCWHKSEQMKAIGHVLANRSSCCCCCCWFVPVELEGAGIHKMKMLQKMRLLEEKGQTFASTPIKELKVFGMSCWVFGLRGCCYRDDTVGHA